jgi:hypothetical protein
VSGDVVLMTVWRPIPAAVLDLLSEACLAWGDAAGQVVLEPRAGGVCDVVLIAASRDALTGETQR